MERVQKKMQCVRKLNKNQKQRVYINLLTTGNVKNKRINPNNKTIRRVNTEKQLTFKKATVIQDWLIKVYIY